MRERVLGIPKRHKGACRHDHLFPRPIKARDVCASHNTRYHELIRAGKTTDEELVRLGMWAPKEKTAEQELLERRAEYERIHKSA